MDNFRCIAEAAIFGSVIPEDRRFFMLLDARWTSRWLAWGTYVVCLATQWAANDATDSTTIMASADEGTWWSAAGSYNGFRQCSVTATSQEARVDEARCRNLSRVHQEILVHQALALSSALWKPRPDWARLDHPRSGR